MVLDKKGDLPAFVDGEVENKTDWLRCFFLTQKLFEISKRQVKGLTADRHSGLIPAFETVFPKLPVQYCQFHYLADVDKALKYLAKYNVLRRTKKRLENRVFYFQGHFNYQRAEEVAREEGKKLQALKEKYQHPLRLRRKIKAFLNAKTKRKASQHLKDLKEQEDYYTGGSFKLQKIILELFRDHQRLLTHFDYKGIPKTTGTIENFNDQISDRLKLIQTFKTRKTAQNFWKLFLVYLRTKKFTFCKGKNQKRNGRSPLELCSVTTKINDWVKFSQRCLPTC